MPTPPQAGEPVADVVPFDMHDGGAQAESIAELAQLPGQGRRVEPAGVGDDLDVLVQGGAEDLLHLAEERRGVAGVPRLCFDFHKMAIVSSAR